MIPPQGRTASSSPQPPPNERAVANVSAGGIWRLAFLFSLLSATLPVPASAVAGQLIPLAGEEGALIAQDRQGRDRWKAEWSQTPHSEAPGLLRFTESGEGRHSPFDGNVRWELESFWEVDGSLLPLRGEKRFTDPAGRPLRVERWQFHRNRGRVRFERQDLPEGRDLERELAVPLDTLTPDGLPTVLRRFLAGSERTLKAHLLTHEPRLYSVTFRLEGEETITTPAGEFDCLRVRMEVDLGFLNLFRVFAPEIRFWFAREWPHFWVRYQGPESGRGSPEIIRIMTHYSRED